MLKLCQESGFSVFTLKQLKKKLQTSYMFYFLKPSYRSISFFYFNEKKGINLAIWRYFYIVNLFNYYYTNEELEQCLRKCSWNLFKVHTFSLMKFQTKIKYVKLMFKKYFLGLTSNKNVNPWDWTTAFNKIGKSIVIE